MEIKVNEFVRIKNGAIRKIIKINEGKEKTILGKYRLDKSYNNCFSVAQNKIVKHSNNIIDLIECGDYVNGHKVVNEIWGEDDNELYFEIEGGFNKAKYIGEKDIKSVLTHEQFSSLEYII